MTRHGLGVALAVSAAVVLAGCALPSTPPPAPPAPAPTLGAAVTSLVPGHGNTCPGLGLAAEVRWRPWSDGRIRIVTVWADYVDGAGTPIATVTAPADQVIYSGPAGADVGDGRDYLWTDADEETATGAIIGVGWSPSSPSGWTGYDVPAGSHVYVDLLGCTAEWGQ